MDSPGCAGADDALSYGDHPFPFRRLELGGSVHVVPEAPPG